MPWYAPWRRKSTFDDPERRFRVEQEAAVLIQRGYATGEARLRAEEIVDEQARDPGRSNRRAKPFVNLFGATRDDLRFAQRALRKTPWFTAAVIATLAVGLGATTVIVSLVEALLLRPLPVADPSSLVLIREEREGPNQSIAMGASIYRYDRYLAYRQATRSVLTDVAAQTIRVFSLRVGNEAQPITGVVTSGNYFQLLGIRPALGQLYSGSDDEPGGGRPVAVVSYDFWRRSLGGDQSVIGKTLYLDGHPLVLMGVAPSGFTGAFGSMFVADVWLPAPPLQEAAFSTTAGTARDRTDTYMWMNMFGRLRPDVSRDQAAAALRTIGPRVPTEDPATRVTRVIVDPLTAITTDIRGGLPRSMTLLLSVAGTVLIIAATNAAGMLLARAMARRREVATRLALGATRARLVRQLLVESVFLCAAAGVAGLLLTWWLTAVLNTWEPPFPMRIALDFGVNGRVLAIAAATVFGTALVAGLLPAAQGTSVDLASAMKTNALLEGTRRTRLRSLFVVAQVALSIVLLAVAGLFARSLAHVLSIDPGFRASGVAHATINLGPHGYDGPRARVFLSQLLARVRARPEVRAAALSADAPLSGNTNTWGATRSDRPNDAEVEVQWGRAGVGFIELLQVPVLAGRTFREADTDSAPRIAVINLTLARRLWPGVPLAEVVGRELRSLDTRLTVVGVMGNGKYMFLQEADRPFAYVPLAQRFSMSPFLYLRARDSTAAVFRAAREELAALDPNIALKSPTLLTGDVDRFLTPQKAGVVIISAFGIVGLLLSATGLYGVLAYSVAQRQREFGVRMALGARAADVVRLVLTHALTLVGIGVVIGLAVAFAVGRLLAGLLFGVEPHDPLTLASVPIILMTVALLATMLPARRAARADPMTSLRAE